MLCGGRVSSCRTPSPTQATLNAMLKQVVYIASAPYSGSTLLDLLLGQQPGCLSLGEVHRLGMPPFVRVRSFGNRCSCRARLHECEHWEGLRRQMAGAVGVPPETDWSAWGITPESAYRASMRARFARWALAALPVRQEWLRQALWQQGLFLEHREAADNSWRFFGHVAAASGAATLIDSTKTATRLFALWRAQPEHLRVIHLVRDGRGVSHSHMKRTHGTIADGVRFWEKQSKPLLLVLRHIDPARRYLCRYEDLCNSPVQTLQRLCDFLSLDLQADRVALPTSLPHLIPGNPMSSRGDSAIRLNEQWKTQLSASDLSYFDRYGAWLNELFGYGAERSAKPPAADA